MKPRTVITPAAGPAQAGGRAAASARAGLFAAMTAAAGLATGRRLIRVPDGRPVVLRDGSAVLIRQVRSTDAPLLADGFGRLSAASRQMRFLSVKKELSAAELRGLPPVSSASIVPSPARSCWPSLRTQAHYPQSSEREDAQMPPGQPGNRATASGRT